jgi:hypothetical protein
MDLTLVAYGTLALSLFVSAVKMGGWILNADPRTLLNAGRWSLLALSGLALALLGWLVNTGRWAAAMMLAAFMLPLFVQAAPRWRALFGLYPMRDGFPPGAGLGTVSGSGTWREPPNPDLVRDSLAVLRAYVEQAGHSLEHQPADTHRDIRLLRGPVNGSGRSARMSTAEALDVLGLAPDASRQEIRDAHRRLMHIVDPGAGGTHYLSTKIDAAREALLGESKTAREDDGATLA